MITQVGRLDPADEPKSCRERDTHTQMSNLTLHIKSDLEANIIHS